jgi:hypothetical protein
MATATSAGQAGGGETVSASSIFGTAVLKGLILYGAVLAFAGLYVFFIVEIVSVSGHAAPIGETPIVVAAALAGVLGSAFALAVGVPTKESETNGKLQEHLETTGLKPPVTTRAAMHPTGWERFLARLHRVLSLEPASVYAASWPRTFGVWTYALIATAVAVTFIFKETETPEAVKALAVAFGGYVIALVRSEYGLPASEAEEGGGEGR